MRGLCNDSSNGVEISFRLKGNYVKPFTIRTRRVDYFPYSTLPGSLFLRMPSHHIHVRNAIEQSQKMFWQPTRRSFRSSLHPIPVHIPEKTLPSDAEEHTTTVSILHRALDQTIPYHPNPPLLTNQRITGYF